MTRNMLTQYGIHTKARLGTVGDAVYADYDGHYVVLTTENDRRATNTIHLDPRALLALAAYIEHISVMVAEICKREAWLPNDLPGPRGQRIT